MNHQAAPPLVDTHAHIFVPGLPLVGNATNRPAYSASDTEYLAALDSVGIRHGVIAAPSFLGTYMDYTVQALRRHPRLRATAIVDPDVPMARLRELDREGFVGVRYTLRNYPEVPDFSSAPYQRLLKSLADLDWHVHILAEPERLAVMIPVLVASGVKVLIDHFGVPSAAPDCPGKLAVQRAMQNGRTWLRMSAPYRLAPGTSAQQLAQEYLRQGGADHLLWGSDWPWVAHEGNYNMAQAIRDLHEWIPNPADRARIDANAMALYRFETR